MATNATLTYEIQEGSTNTPEKMQRVATDILYFFEEYLWTFDPRPEAFPHHLRFELYPFQREFILDLKDRILRGEDVLVEKSRDMGVSWMVLGVFLWFWFFIPGSQFLLGSRKEDLVDSKKVESLYGKLDYMMDRLSIAPPKYSADKHRTYMTLLNPSNGNSIGGESANANFARQGRYKAVLMDEIAFWESPETGWTAAGESTKCRIGVTTPPKRPNFIKYLRFSGRVPVVTLHWKLHPKKDAAWYEAQKLRKLPEEIAQEIDINWEGSITGRVYPEFEHIRVDKFLYQPSWPLYISHDPGYSPDPYALGWWQVDPSTGRSRLIEALETTGKVAEWFLPFFGLPINSEFVYTDDELALIEKVKGWKRAIHYGDVYGRRKDEVTGFGVYGTYQKHGIYVQSNTNANDLESRKTAARRVLVNMDMADTPGTRHFLGCIQNARYPDLAETSNRITPNVKPIHDWTSHMRTMLEFYAVNYLEVNAHEPLVEGLTHQYIQFLVDDLQQEVDDVIS